MAFEEFADHWARRIARHPVGSAERAASIKRCLEALDAALGSRHAPERAEIAERIHTKVVALRRAERFMDGYDDPWGPTGRYGGKLVNWMAQSTPEWVSGIPLSNPEGEKMEKIDWHKPLRAVHRAGAGPKVYTYKSGKQRVTWHDDRVYPVDDFGRVMADVRYPGRGAFTIGEKIVENVPEEEKFFVGLGRNPDGTYWLTDGGTVSGLDTMNYWKKVMGDHPHWIVDTRKSAEPPKAIEHDPEDWTTIYTTTTAAGGRVENTGLMTKAEAEKERSLDGEQVVRVRTTPPPADTARYIVLWREGPSLPWRVNKFGDGRQEFTWAEVGFRAGRPDYCIVKVRD